MKSLMSSLVLVLSLGISTQAFAVSVRSCPASVKIQVSNIRITQSIEDMQKENMGMADDEEIAEWEQALSTIQNTPAFEKEFALDKAANGRCQYRLRVDGRRQSEEKIEIYSSKGKDLVYFQSNVGPRGILLRSYANLRSMNENEITLDEEAGLFLAVPRTPYDSYSAGGTMLFIGKGSIQAFN